MKTFLALRVRKSIQEELSFAKSFNKIDYLDLIKSDSIDYAEFIIVNEFWKLLLIVLSPTMLDTLLFFILL